MELLIWCWHGKLKSKKKYFTDIQGKYLSFQHVLVFLLDLCTVVLNINKEVIS